MSDFDYSWVDRMFEYDMGNQEAIKKCGSVSGRCRLWPRCHNCGILHFFQEEVGDAEVEIRLNTFAEPVKENTRRRS